jgi:FolB domain-containing protein
MLGSQMRTGAEHEIHIEQLELFANIGVSKTERAKSQKLVLNITAWPARDLRDLDDAISRTVDYSALSKETKDFVRKHSSKLIETLADQVAAHLLRKFAVRQITVEVRKFVLPDAAYVSVTVTRRASLD